MKGERLDSLPTRTWKRPGRGLRWEYRYLLTYRESVKLHGTHSDRFCTMTVEVACDQENLVRYLFFFNELAEAELNKWFLIIEARG